jgi:hypothetical protein
MTEYNNYCMGPTPMSNTHERNEQVNVVVTKDQKARWRQYLNENGAEFQNLSHLIRQAVEKEVSSNEPDTPDHSAPDRNNEEVLETIGRLDDKLQGFETRLASIENDVRNDPDVRDIANRLFEYLPTKDELLNYEQTVAEAGTQPPDEVAPCYKSGRIDDLATTIEEPQHRVREGLERLQRDTHQVHTLDRDDETRYYKEGCVWTHTSNATLTASKR